MKEILDISNIVYTGGSDRRIRGFPVGGIRKVLGLIQASIFTRDIVLCFDGGAVLKKELLPTYKAGRVPDYSVMAQIDYLKEICTDCGIPFYWQKDYEADDWIYSFCYFMASTGSDEEIVIRSDDRDLACCITKYVSQKCVTANGPLLTRDNYETQVVRGKVIPYNTLLLYKLFHGDNSDHYGALKIPNLYFEVVAEYLVKSLQPLIDEQGYSEMLYCDQSIVEAALAEHTQNCSELEKKRIATQLRVVFPFLLDVADVSVQQFCEELQTEQRRRLEERHLKMCTPQIDMQKFNFYCAMLGLNKIRRNQVDHESPEAIQFYKTLELKATALSNGEFAVERYGQLPRQKSVSAPANMDLPI